MSKKSIGQKISKAMNVLDLTFKDVIPSSYNGYISSFGASIIQSGLEPTLALFENENASTLEKKQLLPKLILNILDEIVSKGLMTVDELAIFLDINEASIRKYLACSDKPKYKRAVEILFKIFDEIYKPQKHIPIPSAPYQSNYDNSDSYFDGYFSPKTS